MQDKVLDQIISKVNEIGIANEPGSILYSGDETVCKGDIYFMGANPGGHSDQFSNEIEDTVKNQLERKYVSSSFNEYFDAQWQRSGGNATPAGQALLQKRIKFLFQNLELNLKKTLSTNLVFVRSPTLEKFHLDWNEAANRCWAVHEILLEEVMPRIMIVFGDEARLYVETKMIIQEEEVFEVKSQNEIKFFHYRKGMIPIKGKSKPLVLLSTPHLSRYKIDARGIDHGDKFDTRPALNWLSRKILNNI